MARCEGIIWCSVLALDSFGHALTAATLLLTAWNVLGAEMKIRQQRCSSLTEQCLVVPRHLQIAA
jgi:hypothetical protein